MLRFVTATRLSHPEFLRRAPLCLSLALAAQRGGVALQVHTENTTPLPVLYNRALDGAADDDVLAFAHDDLWVDDWLVAQRLEEALERFDVVGVAGTRRRLPGQLKWWWNEALQARDHPHLSGWVGHGARAQPMVNVYGVVPAEAKLLDGVLLAARTRTLRESGVRFDPAFAFDFYDLDFCRQCERAGLRLGTWPIAVTHESIGQGIHGEPWRAAAAAYLRKWGE
jgi:GT2 family glycosyltransferase